MTTYWFSYYFDRLRRSFPKEVFKQMAQNSKISAIIGVVASVFERFENDSAEFEACLNPMTAQGFWLDFWAYFLGEDRFSGEDDAAFRGRIRTSITFGKLSDDALIEAIRPMTATVPQVIEQGGKILQNVAYSSLDFSDYDGQAFVVVLKYRPKLAGANAFYVGQSFIGRNTYVYAESGVKSTNVNQNRIKEIVARTKMAGVKVVHDIS